MTSRIDAHLAWVVENGIIVDEVAGSLVAWAYLAERGVPVYVILRVLSSPKAMPYRNRRCHIFSNPGTVDEWVLYDTGLMLEMF